MITRRNLLKNSGIAALAAASSNLLLRDASSQSASTFDYYISPTGDDNNAGTLASPWSITALNSKMTTYSGKRIGIIGDVGGVQTPIQHGTVGGVQTTIYSMMQTINGGNQNAALKINGGTSSAPTYLGSCTSAGVYQVGWAIIDAANPAGGAAPVGAQAIIMGQPFYQTTSVPNPGYTTIDGLVVRNFNYAGIIFGDVQTTTLYGVIIQNCHIYKGICSTSSENPGGIFLGTTSGAKVLNCLISNCQTTSGFAPWGMGGITTYKALGLIVTRCTITGCGYSWYNNIVYFHTYYNNQGGPYACLSCQGGYGISGTSVDYNYYGTGMTFGTGSNLALGGWQGLGYDTHSTSGGSPFAGTPSSLVPSSFAITGIATTAGRGGAACGALDGSGTVGCNFTAALPAPEAPVLIKVS